jgi:hypothetical protein
MSRIDERTENRSARRFSKALQPHIPMPKLAVKRMQKATTPINHMSSSFIVRVLLT